VLASPVVGDPDRGKSSRADAHTMRHERAFAGRIRFVSMTAEEAQQMALAWLANDEWEPAVTKVEDAVDSRRIFYNNRVYVETRAVSHALAGNLPVLVDKRTGAVNVDAAWRP